jgi:hypothetical protein
MAMIVFDGEVKRYHVKIDSIPNAVELCRLIYKAGVHDVQLWTDTRMYVFEMNPENGAILARLKNPRTDLG